MLARARATLGRRARLKRARAEELPFKDGWFERAVLRLVVHLLDRERAFRELSRVLARDGRLAVATFDPASFDGFWVTRIFPSIGRIDRERFPTARLLEDELEAAGFTVTSTRRLVQDARLRRDDALERIRGRFISTLRLLDEREFAEGVERAERELPGEIDDTRAWLVVVAERP